MHCSSAARWPAKQTTLLLTLACFFILLSAFCCHPLQQYWSRDVSFYSFVPVASFLNILCKLRAILQECKDGPQLCYAIVEQHTAIVCTSTHALTLLGIVRNAHEHCRVITLPA
jgi:hypothetical protein